MKKVFTLFLIAVSILSFNSTTQAQTCNAAFTFTISNFSVQFNPAMNNDTATTTHYWIFGDGSTSSSLISPLHTYSAVGTYSVKHYLIKHNANGAQVCMDTLTKLVIITQPTACNIVANYNSSADSLNSLKVNFTNLSTGLITSDSIWWTFGDGTSSTIFSPSHTYSSAGTYSVCLRIKRINAVGSSPCFAELCKTIIVAPPCNFTIDYSVTSSTSNSLTEIFHNLTSPLATSDSVTWSFGDGSSSHDINPTHTYANTGSYTVCLTVKKNTNSTPINPPCVKTICKTVVAVAPCNLQANYTYRVDSINAQKIWFTDTSIPLSSSDSVYWTFGDGTTSTLFNPDHTYAQPGTYSVCIHVKKNSPAGIILNCTSESCKSIIVLPTCNIKAAYSWRLDSTNYKNVIFTNLTVVTTTNVTVNWFFGDGTSATTWNATHNYAQAGKYYVCLRVQTSTNCVSYKCDSINVAIPLPPCNNQSNFSFLKSSTNNQTITFTPNFQNSIAQYTWTFGDGSGSHDMITTHNYAQAGGYNACLTVWRSAACASTTCMPVPVTPQINCDSNHVSFSYTRDPLVTNKIYFYANSNWAILDQTWTITKITSPSVSPVILHQNNPIYVFSDTGYFNVCLRTISVGGCVKEYCSTIHIERIGNTACVLQVYPNPATTNINVYVPLTQAGTITALIYNSANVLVKSKQQAGVVGGNTINISIGDLVPGMYILAVYYGSSICYSQFSKL